MSQQAQQNRNDNRERDQRAQQQQQAQQGPGDKPKHEQQRADELPGDREEGAHRAPRGWRPDNDTLILVPDEAQYLSPARAELQRRFGMHAGHVVTLIDCRSLYDTTTILVMPLRDKMPYEDPVEFVSRGDQRDRVPGGFAGFLECEPINLGAAKLWTRGARPHEGKVKIKGEGGLADLLNKALAAGQQRLPDGSLVRAQAQGRVTLRHDKLSRHSTETQMTLQLSST